MYKSRYNKRGSYTSTSRHAWLKALTCPFKYPSNYEVLMEEQLKEKKIRWNISKAMSSVYQSLNGSKLKIKKTKTYNAAMENLKALYNINQIQVWILCLACERYFEREDSISLQNICMKRLIIQMGQDAWDFVCREGNLIYIIETIVPSKTFFTR